MSNKFTGITSAGSAIPVYDKDAHSALEQKLDTSAFSSVSGEFATVDDVVAAVSGKADTSAIPSLDGYATQEWVGEQGYLTEVPDEYAKTSAVEDMVSAASADLYSAIGDKLDTSSFADVSGTFLTEVPESAVSGFATHAEVEEATSGKMNVSGLASGQTTGQQWFNPTVYSAYNGIPFFAAYTSGNKLDTSAAEAVSPNFTKNSDQNMGYAKFSGWNGNVGIDISGAQKNKRIYITDEGIILSGYSSHEDAGMNVNGHYLHITPENYVDKTTFKNIVTGNNETFVPNDVKTVSGNYDTQYSNYSFIGDFSGNDNLGREFTVTLPVATTSFRYTACEQDWNWLYQGTLTAEEPKTEWKITPNKDYTAKQDYSISTGTFYTLQITQSPFPVTGGVVSASLLSWNDEVFATRPWVEEQLSANVPQGVMQTSGLEYDGDKISGYMGSAFAGGGEVPEGVMVESAVGFNAVNEISGYNGSAIAQYGAEKQWLIHDDTLVHAANSAQYALGVNLSAVAQLLGVDETVLFEGNIPMTPGSTARCSESIYNFKKIKFLYDVSADNEYQQNSNYTVETDQTSSTNRISWQDGFTINNNWYNRYYNRFTVTNGTDLTLTNANCYWGNTADVGYSVSGHGGHFYKIIGIGRKEV